MSFFSVFFAAEHWGPILCPYAVLAASLVKLRCVSLLTAAGPGYWDAAFKVHGGSAQQLTETIGKNVANNRAVEEIRQLMGNDKLRLGEPLNMLKKKRNLICLLHTVSWKYYISICLFLVVLLIRWLWGDHTYQQLLVCQWVHFWASLAFYSGHSWLRVFNISEIWDS